MENFVRARTLNIRVCDCFERFRIARTVKQNKPCEAELSVTNIEEGEMEQIGSRIYFVDINDILNRKIKEEASEFKPFSVSNEYLENNGKFYDPNSSELEVMVRDSVEDPTEPKFSPAYLSENKNFSDLAGELAKDEVNHFNNEDHSECDDDPLTNNVGSKTKTVKTENYFDVIYDDVKPEIYDGKTENGSYPNVPHELSKDSETWPQQNIEECGTAVGKDNYRTEYYPKFRPSESQHKFSEIPHTEKKSFQCKLCSKSFTDRRTLLQHERTHTGEKPFPCKMCPKSFKQRVELKRHEKIHQEEKQFQCKICCKSYNQKANLTRHVRIHTGNKTFKCKICSKSFTTKASLKIHVQIHTGEKPFQCKTCLKSFTQKTTLMVHERMHTGEKPFQCKICCKSYNQKANFTRHVRIHTGEDTFQCKICSKSFNQKVDLARHERIHTGEKPFQCKICLRSFTRKSTLSVHERIHTGKKPFQCKICPKSFKQGVELTKHEKIHQDM